jgi:hypothetical protein
VRRKLARHTTRTKERAGIVRTLLGAALLLTIGSLGSQGSELNGETLRAWNEYTQALDLRVATAARAKSFLWIDQSPDRIRRVREGEVLVAPVGENPKLVPHGLIHHWIGAMFLPDAVLDDVLKVVRDYDRYKDVYAPNVLDSKLLQQAGTDDVFSLLLLNKAVVAKVALHAEFRNSYQALDKHRWYSVGHSTRIREVEEYGQPDQRDLAPNTGHGFIWRLYSISRFEQRDGGVYVEVEGVALSRDVPSMVRWLVGPVIRNVSRSSMLVSLQKTEEAVRATSQLAAAPGRKIRNTELKSVSAEAMADSAANSGAVARRSFQARP